MELTLPKLNLDLKLPNPEWEAIRDSNGICINMDSYSKIINTEVEVIQLNLSSKTMRVRFHMVNGLTKRQTTTCLDIGIEPFFEHYNIIKQG